MSGSMTKPTKFHMHPAKTQISLGICPVWSESSLCALKDSQGPKASSCGQQRLIRLGGCTGWSESSLNAQVILLVLSCWGSSMSMTNPTKSHYSSYPSETWSICTSLQSGQSSLGAVWLAKDPKLLHAYSKDCPDAQADLSLCRVLLWFCHALAHRKTYLFCSGNWKLTLQSF